MVAYPFYALVGDRHKEVEACLQVDHKHEGDHVEEVVEGPLADHGGDHEEAHVEVLEA